LVFGITLEDALGITLNERGDALAEDDLDS
jgi:hypothetical protein